MADRLLGNKDLQRDLQRRCGVGGLMTTATAATTGWRSRGRFICRCRRRSAATFEICGIPAATLELEAGRSQLLDKSVGMAGRAGGEHGITHFLQYVFRMAARRTTVSVNRHGKLQKEGNYSG